MTQGTNTGTAEHPAFAAVEALTATLQLARALHDTGRPIDLAGLDAQAATLCTAVALLPAAVARPLRPALESLAREVDALSTALASR